jgi:hypothetical protein
VENHAAPAVRNAIRSGLDALTHEQREDIAAFVATQQLRVPSHRTVVAKNLSTTLDRVRSRLTEDPGRWSTRQRSGGAKASRIRRDLTRPTICAGHSSNPMRTPGLSGVCVPQGGFIDDIRPQIEALRERIISGEIAVPVVPEDRPRLPEPFAHQGAVCLPEAAGPPRIERP